MASQAPLSRRSTATTGSTIDGFGGVKPRLSLPKKGDRDRSPAVDWKQDIHPMQPRCLVVNYKEKEPGQDKRRTEAVEIYDITTLKRECRRKRTPNELRFFHVQNWSEGTRYLIHKFELRGEHEDNLTVLPGFNKWITKAKPSRRAGKPLLEAKTFKLLTDPWRQINKCAVGLDFLKRYKCSDYSNQEMSKATWVTGLQGYDDTDNPVLHSNVFGQRMAMYVQFASADVETPGEDMHMKNPYPDVPLEQVYDNGNTVILFDNSHTGSCQDTLVPARGELEARWRRLPWHISSRSPTSPGGDEKGLTSDCMREITQDIFKAIANVWDDLLDASWEHVSILEDKIFEHPADESRAPELWRNSAKWLVYEKLMYGHQDAILDMQQHLVRLDNDTSDEGMWLRESPTDFERLANLIEEDLVKRTQNLSELMYKSVGIRDSRESLRLGASMWRLSWITFIFLPLTFLTSFLGMNVDTFRDNPPIKWYFISAVPFMLLVLIFWYLLKHWFAKSRQMPLQRGAYEALFTELQTQRSELWTRTGPKDIVHPADRMSRIKWHLIRRWTTGDAIPRASGVGQEDEPIGQWNRMKRYLIQRWTNEIELAPMDADLEAGRALINAVVKTALPPVAMIESETDVAEEGSERNSRVMVEEISEDNNGLMTDEGPVPPVGLGVKEVDWAADTRGRVQERGSEGVLRKEGKKNQ